MAKKIITPGRGEIYLVNFNPALGSEVKKTRPALILQNDVGNEYSPVTIVAAITSQISKGIYPTNVFLKKSQSGLKEDSLVLLNQVRTIDKQRLIKRLGSLDKETMTRVERALLVSLGLIKI